MTIRQAETFFLWYNQHSLVCHHLPEIDFSRRFPPPSEMRCLRSHFFADPAWSSRDSFLDVTLQRTTSDFPFLIVNGFDFLPVRNGFSPTSHGSPPPFWTRHHLILTLFASSASFSFFLLSLRLVHPVIGLRNPLPRLSGVHSNRPFHKVKSTTRFAISSPVFFPQRWLFVISSGPRLAIPRDASSFFLSHDSSL